MKYVNIILGLATACTALDFRFHEDKSCTTKASEVCAGMEANTCCSPWRKDTNEVSLSFTGIPGDWSIEARGYQEENCTGRLSLNQVYGSYSLDGTHCMEGMNFRSAGFGWITSPNPPNKECQKPNRLILEDGTEVNLDPVAKQGQVDQLMNMHAKKKDDLKDFQQYVIPPK